MSWPEKTQKDKDITPSNIRLDDDLSELIKLGKTRLCYLGNGWHCSVDMFVADQVKGVEFKVASEFKKSTPKAATSECLERALKALRDSRH